MMITTFLLIKCLWRKRSCRVILSDDSEDFAEVATNAAQGREGNASTKMEDVEIYESSPGGATSYLVVSKNLTVGLATSTELFNPELLARHTSTERFQERKGAHEGAPSRGNPPVAKTKFVEYDDEDGFCTPLAHYLNADPRLREGLLMTYGDFVHALKAFNSAGDCLVATSEDPTQALKAPFLVQEWNVAPTKESFKRPMIWTSRGHLRYPIA